MKPIRKSLTATAVALVSACVDTSTGPPLPGAGGTNLECVIPSEEIFSGGVGRDGIPALTNPGPAEATQPNLYTDDTRVLGIVVNGKARAYPFDILWWHEVVNDTLGGQPVLVTYCPLTGSGIAFDPRVDARTAREFGVSGLLWRTNLTMFDRETETLWNQMSLGGTCGVDRGKDLQRIPIVETTWGNWQIMHPSTTVMTRETGFFDRPYGLYPYGDYAEPDNGFVSFLAPGTTFSNLRPPKELVLGFADGASAKAYPFGVLGTESFAVGDVVEGTPLLVTYLSSQRTAMAFDRRVKGEELTFTADPTTQSLTDDQTGSRWNTRGEALDGPLQGEQLSLLPDAFVAFWFAWSIYHQNTDVYLAQ